MDFFLSQALYDPERSDEMNDQSHPELHDVPIGIRAIGMRRETDPMGEIEVPTDRY
jgi:fumarate hydratase, class II